MIQSPESKYFLLEEKDIMKPGDEFYNPHIDKWEPLNDGKPACPRCESENIILNPNRCDESNERHCNDCFHYFDHPIYPNSFIGNEFNPSESKPVRRINPKFIGNGKPKLRIHYHYKQK